MRGRDRHNYTDLENVFAAHAFTRIDDIPMLTPEAIMELARGEGGERVSRTRPSRLQVREGRRGSHRVGWEAELHVVFCHLVSSGSCSQYAMPMHRCS